LTEELLRIRCSRLRKALAVYGFFPVIVGHCHKRRASEFFSLIISGLAICWFESSQCHAIDGDCVCGDCP
jgi:hypothetical protein